MDTTIDGVRLHYALEGQGSDLILIHGLGGSLHDWDAITPVVAKHHRVLRWDVRGFGESDKPAGPYSPQLFARDLAGLCRAVGISNAHVAGISMGGVIAQRFVLDFPDLVRSLTLMSTSSEVGEQAQKGWLKLADNVEQRGFSTNPEAAARAFSPGFAKANANQLAVMAERTAKNTPHAYAAAARAVGTYNWTTELGRIDVPTLILQGLEDVLTPPGGSVKLSRGISRSRLLMIPECGHGMTMEKPEVVTNALLAFVAGLELRQP
ncbi:MAG: alpha/beta fold hydrolase [Deltaproteobacteria bacterium]|nr:alpha/beta fold hydrolase [Deltaproteobacteria bacterium]